MNSEQHTPESKKIRDMLEANVDRRVQDCRKAKAKQEKCRLAHQLALEALINAEAMWALAEERRERAEQKAQAFAHGE